MAWAIETSCRNRRLICFCWPLARDTPTTTETNASDSAVNWYSPVSILSSVKFPCASLDDSPTNLPAEF
jgi:hypothetical protein